MRTHRGVATLTASRVAASSDTPLPTTVSSTLPNGLRVIFAENHTVPVVWLNWVCLGGFEHDPVSLAGIAALTPDLLREGTVHREAGQIANDLDDLAAEVIAGADWDAAFLNLELLSADLAAGIDLLIEMACYPAFAEEAVARRRQRRLAEIERRRRHPFALADDEFARAVYGATGYGRSPLGTAESVRLIEAADVTAFHRSHYRRENAIVVLAGSFESREAADRLSSFELPPSRVPKPLSPAPFAIANDATPGIRLVAVPPAAQTELRVGHAGVSRDCEDLPQLQVLNTILGRGPSSRLAGILRQRHGVTYHVRSRFAAWRFGGSFVVETSVASEAAGAALDAIRREIERLREEIVPAADVEQAKRRLLGAELRQFQSIRGTGVSIGPVALEVDPAIHFERWNQAIAAVEPDGLRELARRHLHPERLVAVAVGPRDALRSQFSSDGARRCRPSALESKS
jgi:zinc protease